MTSTDPAIREESLAECERQSWAPMINVVVQGGIVELHGAVTDDRERQALIVASENVCGVAAVHDQLVWIEPTGWVRDAIAGGRRARECVLKGELKRALFGKLVSRETGCRWAISRKGLNLMNNHHHHAVIWIDHHEARVFHFSPTDVERLVLHPDHPTRHIHHKANSVGSGHAAEDHNCFRAVVGSIADAGAILITGPASAKTELVKHIHRHDPKRMAVIVGVETVDHPSDAALVAYARKYFKAADRMLPQTPQTAAAPSK